ncbi:sugar diacid recognition domain-containing protein [Bacillus sp. 165]|uniref:CdaR family transcriptional regulator n=1 Tax=Bacillus sp. 165 TaxID=1529117 RepID=UPI001ADAFFA0|nr:sugar diacid recognition domain-containing protein [Bacillus sp. 165]MBO9128475.1 helix-turn-helix domain-containing protein [Bacillus sp. 165]
MLLPSLAKKIVQEVRRLITEDIIIIDVNGIIIASTDSKRLNTFHESALLCCQQKKTVVITKEDEHHLTGVKAGINLPLLFNDEVVGVIGITGEPERISQYGELMRKMTELLIHENYFTEQLEIKQRSYEAFLFDWLHSKDLSSSLTDRAKMFGIDINAPQQLILFSIDNADSTLQSKLWQYIHSQISMEKEKILVRWGNERLILLQQAEKETIHTTRKILEKIQQDCHAHFSVSLSIGVGKPVSPTELYLSYDQALRALEVSLQEKKIVFNEDLRLEMCLQDIQSHTRTEFLQRTIKVLLDEKELLYTLKLFMETNQSYKQTAETLHIHINTLHYRFKKIENLTGLNPKNFKDLVTLYISLALLEDYPKK